MNAAGVDTSNVGNHHRRRCGYGDDEPDDNEEQASGEGDQLQDLGMARRVMADCTEGDQEHHRGNSGNYHEADVDGAVQDLASMAMVAFGKVLLVVTPHLRRDTGNVKAPPGQNISDYLICTNTHRKMAKGASSSITVC